MTKWQAAETTEVKAARIERDEQAGLADLRLRLAEAKRLIAGSRRRLSGTGDDCQRALPHMPRLRARLASKGQDTATSHSLFGNVPIRDRRLPPVAATERAQQRASPPSTSRLRSWRHSAARRHSDEPVSTALVVSSVNEIIAKRLNNKPQMRCNRAMVLPFCGGRIAGMTDPFENALRCRYPGFRLANGNEAVALAAY